MTNTLANHIRHIFALMVELLNDNTGEYTFKIGKNTYIVNEIFPEKGKTFEQLLVDLILYEIDNGDGSKKKNGKDEKEDSEN